MNTKFFTEAQVDQKWFLIDVTNVVLGRVASQVAFVLQGKHKPKYSPNALCGDNIIIINAAKIKVTGNKLAAKQYHRHTGYPGGIRSTTLGKLLAVHPTRPMEQAVRKMLPTSRLGRKMLRRCHIYAGDKHAHDAQKPVALSFDGNDLKMV